MQYTDIMTGGRKYQHVDAPRRGHNRWRDDRPAGKHWSNRYVVQLGETLQQWGWGDTDRWHLGVMAGCGDEHNNTDSVRTGYRSKSAV
ncbi:autotransporter outer membrane beta-barrel domain-containing protein [Escherichia coli]|nr:autotransporter outer membrane beta-barrel domain-containing protein [Escherichia coli]